jgi:hypothetical protein
VSTGATGFSKDPVALVLFVEASGREQFAQMLFVMASLGLLEPPSSHCRTFFKVIVWVTELRISISRLLESAGSH